MKWFKVEINTQNIKYETERAVLIKLPNKSNLKNLCFWHPKKLVRAGSNSYAANISFSDEFVFKLFRQHSKEIDREVGYQDIIDAFEGTEIIPESTETYCNVIEPAKINKEVKVLAEFKNE